MYTSNTALIRSQFIPLAFAYMRDIGAVGALDKIRSDFDVPEPNDALLKEVTLPLATYRAVTDMAAEVTGDDSFGIHVAEYCPRGHFGLVELAARFAPNIREALTRISRYMRLLTNAETLHLEARESAREVALVHQAFSDTRCLGRQASMFTISVVLRLMRQLVKGPVHVKRVEFADAAPRSTSTLEQEFQTSDIRFDAGHNSLVFDESIGAVAVASHDPTLLPWLDRHAELLLPPGSPTEGLLDVRQRIREALVDGRPPTLTAIASHSGQSARTLQRHLAAMGTSFQRELDGARMELAESLLRDRGRKLHDIALSLGYADLRGFVRGFIRCKGMTPGQFRRTYHEMPPQMANMALVENALAISMGS